jgi:hypothetical protein
MTYSQPLCRAKRVECYRTWVREHPGQGDEAWFEREVASRLDAFTLSEIAAATGLSLAEPAAHHA